MRASISRGIIAEAVATGHVVLTPSALLDPRFRDRASVRRSKIDAVLCAPIGRDPPRGVLYLQSSQGTVFASESVSQVELSRRAAGPARPRTAAPTAGRKYGAASRACAARLSAADVVGTSNAITAVPKKWSQSPHSTSESCSAARLGPARPNLPRSSIAIVHAPATLSSSSTARRCPGPLISSELFGSLPGSHSTASRRVDGKVFAADGGTLFLGQR